MGSNSLWIKRQVQLGTGLLVLGLLVGVIGISLERITGDLPFNERIITGVGILLSGVGISYLVRYRSAIKDEQAARRLMQEERDERTQLIKDRAGHRAYLVSAALAYILLMWVSFADNGSLPTLSADVLWYALAAVVIVPGAVYIGSQIYDQKHM